MGLHGVLYILDISSVSWPANLTINRLTVFLKEVS